MTPFSLVYGHEHFRGTYCLHVQGRRFYSEAGASMFLQNVGTTYQTTWCHCPEDHKMDLYRRENLKSCK
jgi:hypothetical protein